MIKIDKRTRDELISLFKTKNIALEGNILKLIDPDGDAEFEAYLKESVEKDMQNRRKRLEITKKIQAQNKELIDGEKENERVKSQLTIALEEAEDSRREAVGAKEQAEKAMMDAQWAGWAYGRSEAVSVGGMFCHRANRMRPLWGGRGWWG